DLRAVKEWLQEARNAGHHPGVMALTTAAATAAKLGDVVSAEGFFAEAAAAPKGDDDSLDVAAYSAVVAAAAKAREIHKAERWLCRAAAAGEKCQPNAYTYTSVGTAALLDARRVLAWLDRATFALGFASTQPLHNVFIQSSILLADLKGAEAGLSRLLSGGLRPDGFSFGPLLRGAERQGDSARSGEWCIRMDALGVQ
ncbi:unnamed protein product, partial [Symbiodinium microadriaticum]